MNTLSVWRGIAPSPGFAMLSADISTDVLIIGGGITGVTLAWLLARQGRQVTLLEAHEIGSGTTGNSTGNLYETLSHGLHDVSSRWGKDVARQVVAERRAALQFIQEQAQDAPGAAFRRCPLVLYALADKQQSLVDQEFEALSAAGCAVQRGPVPAALPAAAGPAVILADQAQFQPQAYLVHLAQEAARAGARIHEHSRVLDINARTRIVDTATGAVNAREIVMATHTPKGIRLVHAEMPVYREYAVALPFVDGARDPGPGIFWAKGEEGLSMRTLEQPDGRRFLICVGQEHPPGAHNAKAALMAVEAAAQRHFGDAEPAYRWSAQHYKGADGLPYIGRDASGCLVATGFATDGLTWGTVAARLLAEEVADRSPPFAALCKPTRLSPIKGARTILEEATVTARSLVKDYLTHRQEEKLSSLAPGDSAVVDSEGESCAAWRSPQGELFAVSSVCTHMGCKVHWNSVETSWDCPCHGSRFRPDGTVIEGPALRPLARRHPRSLEP
ncbi:FAD-dependent oxidoreductase [Ramlibacter rhizophilus]|uniref:FAD-dependent oxidoreductase n=1 Tax=Ramlibacter rhizophilus TaxID=1781167 RepID=A0A4Z0BWR9_9BURK|nr:FAD-dependent oxidoreductase [Ramlibacter rhizophilus]TFZ03351.1 FAD-dependent oxidoreductase [Ramlibacter rhizophilus]